MCILAPIIQFISINADMEKYDSFIMPRQVAVLAYWYATWNTACVRKVINRAE